MGTAVWILLWGITCCMAMQQMVISPPATTSECSTWGNHYFQTFDGAQYTFPGTCFYLFAQQCTGSRITFNIVVRRSIRDGNNVILFSAIIDDIDIEVTESGIAVQGNELIGSYSEKSVLVEQDCAYLIMTSKLGVVLKWNYNDTLLLYLEDKYKGSTCGLCGDYNGDKTNDVAINDVQVSPRQFGNQQKINRPSEKCPDVPADANGGPTGANQCAEEKAWCASIIKRVGNCYGFLAIDDYVTMCTNDMCTCASNSSVNCACGTLNMYSRRCVQAGGDPGKWRKSGLCDRPCPENKVYMECGSPCPNTCSNPLRSSLCSDAKCTDGCFCHTGMILDDVMNTGCVPWGNCPCTFKGKSFASGDHYSTACQTCACLDGQWNCKSQPCSGYCEVLGGSHINTYDGKGFSFNGNCLYVISKSNDIAQSFTVLGELFQCGMSSTVTCLKTVSLVLKYKVIKVCHCGSVYINEALVNLPFKDAEVIILKRSTDFITIQSTLQVQLDIQLNPVMQLFVYMNASYKGQVSGLCGNFNGLEVDDTQTTSGVIEESAAAFANSWKTQASCPDSKDICDDPCSASSDKEQYAEHWCSLLNNDVFAGCSMFVDATPYYKNCKYDTCNSESSQDALIAILSAYAKHCTDEGVILDDWKDLITDSSASCPKSMVFSTAVRFCNASCFSLTQKDPLCDVVVNPVQGCGCPDGTYLDSYGTCVSPDSCTCIYKDDVISPGETFQEGSITCKCIQGKIECIGAPKPIVCSSPMQFYDCESGGSNPVGTECQKSCTTQNNICYSKQCVSGCVCPNGLVTDGNGGCITEDQCPCMHNGKAYQRGQNITNDCNTCTCMNRIWTCTANPCTGVCSVYGNGHYLSFDGKQFDYTTHCDYILTQDFCPNNPKEGTFRVIGEVTSCGHNNAICAVTVRIKIKSTEMRLVEGGVQMIQTGPNPPEVNYTLSIRGLYIEVTTSNGVTIMWDQRTTVFVRLETSYAGMVCGLCGNFNGRENDDFTTQGQSLETNAQSFGNSWKVTSSCPNTVFSNLCSANPYRQVWAQRHCSIIKSDLFRPCHTMVNPMQYYDSCVSDACACDSGGDCECFCSAVAVYAQACSSAGVCIDWRTPDQCPPFCDYYNPKGECSWHYEPCGSSCLKTCRNPRQRCADSMFSLEGCYPQCTGANSYYDDALMTCVPLLSCTTCTPEEMLCSDDLQDCLCCFAGKTYRLHQEIYRGGNGKNCLTATCGSNGQIKVDNYPCGSHPYAPTTAVLPGSTIRPVAHVSDAVGPGGSSSLGGAGDGGDMPIMPNTPGIQPAVGGSASGNQNSASGTQDSSSTVLPGSTISPIAHVSDAVGPGGPSSLGGAGDGGDMPIMPSTHEIQSAVGGSASGNQNSASGTQDSSSTVLPGSTISPIAHVSDAVGPGGPSSLGGAGDGGDMPIMPSTHEIQSAVGGSASGNQNSASGTQDSSSTVLPSSTISPIAHVSDAVGPGGPSSLGGAGDGGDMPIMPSTHEIQSAVGGSASGNQNSASGTQDSSSTVLPGSTISPIAHVSDAVGSGGPSSLGGAGDGGDMPIMPSTHEIQSAVGGSASGNQNSASGTQDLSSTVLAGSTISPIAHVSDAVGPGGSSSLGGAGDGGDMPIMPNTHGIQPAVGGSASGNQNSESGTQDSSSTVFPGSTISPIAHVSDAVGPGGSSSLGGAGDGGDMSNMSGTPVTQSAVGGITSGSQSSASTTQQPSSTGCMEEQCYWSDWYDTMKPNLASLGDFETIASIRETDSSVCSAPSDIDCRAGQVPEVPLTDVGQKVTCNPTVGLECYNADQAIPLCYNYIVKIKCCSLVPCTTKGPTSGPDNGLTTARSNSCVEMSGVQRAPGDQWQEDCSDYTCNSESLDITSVPHACPTSAPVVCTNEGQVARNQTLLADPCCTETVCVCDTQQCSTSLLELKLGWQMNVNFPSNSCCPQYTYIPKNVCVYNGMEYQPGYAVPSDSCQDCNCSDSFDPMLETNALICSPRVCSTDCEPGFIYENAVDGCCGMCKQTACAVSFPSGVITIEPNSEYQAPDNNCTLYRCMESNGQLINMPVDVSCPYLNPDNCIAGTIGKSSDGCCDTCIEVSQGCQMITEMKSIVNDGCVTTDDIEVRSCEGACSSSYMFYAEVSQMVLECSCCRDRQSHIEEITLFCPDTNTTTPYKYTFVDNCGCSKTNCV